MKNNGVSPTDFARRKKMTRSSDIKLYDSTWDIASALLDNTVAGVELFDEFDLINSLTVDDANKLLCELFRHDMMTFSIVLPEKQ